MSASSMRVKYKCGMIGSLGPFAFALWLCDFDTWSIVNPSANQDEILTEDGNYRSA